MGERGKELILATIGIAQCRFDLLPITDVPGDLGGSNHAPRVVADRRDGQRDVQAPPVLRHAHGFEMIDSIALPDLFKNLALLLP